MATPYSRYVFGRIPWYSVLILFGVILAILLASREEKKMGLPADTIIDLALLTLPVGILGARIYYVIFSWESYRTNPLSVLFIWQGGLAIYGGLIAGGMAVFLFCRKRNLSVRVILDLLAPGVVFAQAIGRWGNYFNMEAYGQEITDPELQFFPFGVLVNGSWHMAVFFYESLWNLFVYVFLLIGKRKLFRKPGDLFLFYILLYASGRLVLEEFRLDSLYIGTSVRISQLLSVITGFSVFFLLYRRRFLCNSLHAYHWADFVLVLFLGSVVILFCLGKITLFSPSLFLHAGFLSFFSLFLVISCLLIYG